MKVRWNLEGYVDAVFKADLGGDGFQEQATLYLGISAPFLESLMA